MGRTGFNSGRGLVPAGNRGGFDDRGAMSLAGRGGFTLIETALAIVIVSTGVLAIVAAQQAYHQHNTWSLRVGTALMLANEIREITMTLPRFDPISGDDFWGPEANEAAVGDFDDMDDFDGDAGEGITFNPPIDASRQVIPGMEQWTQIVVVENVLDNLISGAAAPDHSTGIMRVTCRVLYQGPRDPAPVEITRLTWVRAGER
jgi:hypothetical protein